jgi:membrane fusion protein (multidrug efflux system)
MARIPTNHIHSSKSIPSRLRLRRLHGFAEYLMKAWFFIVPGLILMACLAGCGSSNSSANAVPSPPKAVKVEISKIKPITIKDILVLPGETEARHDITLAAERDGRVERIVVTEGHTLKKGDLMLEIDVAALKAALDRAQAAYSLADHIADRRESLHEGQLVAKGEARRSRYGKNFGRG